MAGLRINPACTTRNLRSALLSTGRFTAHTKALYLTDDSHARRGGIFLKEGSHAVMALENGAQADSINAAHTSPQTAVDVSAYQGTIDWKRVKNAGIRYAVLRGVTKNGSLDSAFERNYTNAIQNDIRLLGVYQFSYALNEEDARNAAHTMIRKLNGRKLPIWLDLEWAEQRKLGKDKVTAIAGTYIHTCRESGYTCDIYSNLDWYKNVYHARTQKPRMQILDRTISRRRHRHRKRTFKTECRRMHVAVFFKRIRRWHNRKRRYEYDLRHGAFVRTAVRFNSSRRVSAPHRPVPAYTAVKYITIQINYKIERQCPR